MTQPLPNERTLSIAHVTVPGVAKSRSLYAPVTVHGLKKDVTILALIDSGAMETYIHPREVIRLRLIPKKLARPIPVFNVDDTPNKKGSIRSTVRIPYSFGGEEHEVTAYIADIGSQDIILGYQWLNELNPEIDWDTGTISLRRTSNPEPTELERTNPPGVTTHEGPFILDEPIEPIPQEPILPDEPSTSYEERLRRMTEDLDPEEFLCSYQTNDNYLVTTRKEEFPLTSDLPYDFEYVHHRKQTINRIVRCRGGLYIPMSMTIGKVTTATELAAAKSAEKPPKTLAEMIPPYLNDLLPVFDKGTASRLPGHTAYDHEINLKPGFSEMKTQVYPLNPAQKVELDKFITENESKGYIRPSKSPMASPFFFVAKKDGSWRPCQDYRTLNENTVKDRYPLPLISDLMDKFKNATIFTKMDLRAGYNNVRIKEGDEWKAAFAVPATDGGPPRLFEPLVMFFGLCNSPSTFQRMMNTIFADMLNEGWLVIYMDDILIFSSDPKVHRERTRRVIQRLRDNDLYLKPEKCYFDVPEVEFLGLILKPGQLAMDPIKVEGVTRWPIPRNVKEVRSFVGFANFYRRFIHHFSERVRPLVDLTKKNIRWHWDNEQQTAFEDLKSEFVKAPVLRIPDDNQPFALECDSSLFATGGVLLQKDSNGDMHPCGFISQSLNPAERNYQIYDRELLAIIRGLETWEHHFLGSPHRLQIRSDHKNLTYWRTARKLNRRQARWSLYLSQFDYELVHVPGSQMTVSDALSRRSDHDDGKTDNEDLVMIPDNAFARRIEQEEHVDETNGYITMFPHYLLARAVNAPLLEAIQREHERDPIVLEAIQALQGNGPVPA